MQRKNPPRARKRVLFVDDMKGIHNYERKIAKSMRLKPKFAFGPKQAKKIIELRKAAIGRLVAKKTKQLSSADGEERTALLRQINFLGEMKKRPFDLVVSDINMPSGRPVGVDFLIELKKELPLQKTLVHSDDEHNMNELNGKHGIPNSPKDYYSEFANDESLKRKIREQLQKKNKK